jgi:hypothetical protein
MSKELRVAQNYQRFWVNLDEQQESQDCFGSYNRTLAFQKKYQSLKKLLLIVYLGDKCATV